MNDETERVNSAIDFETGQEGTIPEVAKAYKARGQPWMIVTDVRRIPYDVVDCLRRTRLVEFAPTSPACSFELTH